jgi:hypothetical protein
MSKTVRDKASPYEAAIGFLRIPIEKIESRNDFNAGTFNLEPAYKQIHDGGAMLHID